MIDASKYWIYNKNIKKDSKWRFRKKFVIVRVYPKKNLIPTCVFDKFVEFCFSELLIYKPFCDIAVDIGDDSITIVSNWESLEYVALHVE